MRWLVKREVGICSLGEVEDGDRLRQTVVAIPHLWSKLHQTNLASEGHHITWKKKRRPGK